MPTTARGRHTIELLSVFTVLTTLSLAGRFWSAALQKRSYRLDDFLVVFAFVGITDNADDNCTETSFSFACWPSRYRFLSVSDKLESDRVQLLMMGSIAYTHNLGAHTADLTEPQRVLLLKVCATATAHNYKCLTIRRSSCPQVSLGL